MIKANLEKARLKAKDTRLKYGLGDYEFVDIFKILQYNENVNIIKMPFTNEFSGAILEKGNIKTIMLNSSMTLGRQIFTLAHELYHLLYDSLKNGDYSIEAEADEFASHFLMPEIGLLKQLESRDSLNIKNIDISDLIFIQQFFMISHQALLKRLRLNPEDYSSINLVQQAKLLGYDSDLYLATNEELKIHSNLPEIAKKLLEENKITQGKYYEYLESTGYSDIIL